MACQFLSHIPAGIGRLSREQEEERATERVDITSHTGSATVASLLGSHVIHGADGCPFAE